MSETDDIIEYGSDSVRESNPLHFRDRIFIERGTYTHDSVRERYPLLPPKHKAKTKKFSFADVFPIISTLRKYKWKEDGPKDILAGLTVAFLHMPQGLAYGLLASLSPVSGLYTSFIAVTTYVIFGTCPQLSMGTNSVLSLVTAEMVEREVALVFNETQITMEPADDESRIMTYKLCVSMMATLMCGAILLAMGVVRMGFLTSYMPSSFVGGFTTGAAIHIATSQVKHVFQIHVPVRSGKFKLIYTYIDIANQLQHTNIADTIICLVSAFFLLVTAISINPRLNAKAGFVIPHNLVVVILATIASHVGDFKHNYSIATVGLIPEGFPTPELPNFSIALNVAADAVTLALITFSMTITMAVLMARIHGYEVDSNKELIAYGIGNIASSFFQTQASSVSPPRTMLLSNAKARTVLNGCSTAIFLLLTLLFAGELFQALPIATLAAMILVAVKDLLLQFKTVPFLWRISKTDFLVWVTTCAAATFLDLAYGIALGVGLSVFGVVYNNQAIKGHLIVTSVNEDLLIEGKNRLDVTNPPGIRVYYFPSQLFFANAEDFKNQLFHNVFDPNEAAEIDFTVETRSSFVDTVREVRCLVLDCSAMTYIDFDGVCMLKMVVVIYNQAGIQVLLARCPDSTMKSLEKADFFDLLPRDCVFHEVVDAIKQEEVRRQAVSKMSIAIFQRGYSCELSISPTEEINSDTPYFQVRQ